MSEFIFSEEDKPLQDDIRSLGSLLGEILQDQNGESLFEQVETIRTTARVAHIHPTVSNREALRALLVDMTPREASLIIQAFSTLCALSNLAERVHRLRRQRESSLLELPPEEGSFEYALKTLSALPADKMQRLIDGIRLTPVLTAHPTEATRRTVLSKELRIASQLLQKVRQGRLTRQEEHLLYRAIQREIACTWQTREHLAEKPTVADEVEHALFYLSRSMVPSISLVSRRFNEAMMKVYGYNAIKLRSPMVRFASWVGGDMDGNPNVGGDTIRETLKRHRSMAKKMLQDEIKALFGQLSQSLSKVNFEPSVLERIEHYRQLLPEASASVPPRYESMPYRVLLWLMWARLGGQDGPKKDSDAVLYQNPSELLQDLKLIADSLRLNRGRRAGLDLVTALIEKVKIMGFHLAALDVRQDALIHSTVLKALEGGEESSETQRVLDVFHAIAESKAQYGEESMGLYIISMARSVDDVKAVLTLARKAKMVPEGAAIPLDIAPLLETAKDLEAGASILESMFQDPIYQAHLKARDNNQVVVIGYSDSNKDAGIASARWALQKAQYALTRMAQAHGVKLTLFHGRGGTVSRGGGSPRQGVLAAPFQSLSGRLRATEQGEIVHAKYGIPELSAWTLESMLSAVIEKTGKDALGVTGSSTSEWRELMDLISMESEASYRAIVEHPLFMPFFRKATPIDLIEQMPLGSRPARRRSKTPELSDLRAIPWVFAWTQSRMIFSAYYGLGTGLEAARKRFGLEALQDMVKHWPFFTALLSDVEMVLAKVNLDIGARYAALADEDEQVIFELIKKEYERSKSEILAIRGSQSLLQHDPALSRAIRLRAPYTDPLSILQIDLLKRWREGGRQDQELKQTLIESVIGIARGMQNTG